ncbi:MAG: hypothetical protein MK212_04260 [Saprospiraceae bacterium]|nr:hypothetical protein [Saprospiraceae bacterium]
MTKLVKHQRIWAGFLLSLFFVEIFAPAQLWATTGPTSPEFSDFESVSTSNMVNPFTGDFTYNLPVLEIPGPNGGSYAMSLSYHSGANITDDPSWVGYGWTLNPGAITRNTKGFPDDYAEDVVTYYNKTKPNYTIELQPKFSLEAYSSDPLKKQELIYRYNSYHGHSILLPEMDLSGTVNISDKIPVDVGLSFYDGVGNIDIGHKYLNMNVNSSSGFSAQVGVASILNDARDEFGLYSGHKLADKAVGYMFRMANTYGNRALSRAISGHLNFKSPYLSKHKGFTGEFSPSVQFNPMPLLGNLGMELGVNSKIYFQKNEEVEEKKVLGYLYSGGFTPVVGSEYVQDYHLEHQSAYNRRTEFLHIPFSNADNFIVSGEGVSGSFRAFSKLPGQFRPNAVTSKSVNITLSPEIGLGTHLSLGGEVGAGYHEYRQGAWDDPRSFGYFNSPYDYSNMGAKEYDKFFFRFANDRGGMTHYSDNDNAEAFTVGKSTGSGAAVIPEKNPRQFESLLSEGMGDGKQEGRSNHIAYNTSKERWLKEGSSNYYRAFSRHSKVNSFLQENDPALEKQLSEFKVEDPSGRRFVYGLPVYAREEAQLSYGLFKLKEEVSIENNYKAYIDRGSLKPTDKVWVTGEEKNTPYASQYLLTQITTPDYVDLGDVGPDEADLGGWVRFDYDQYVGDKNDESKVKSSGEASWYRWRMPYTGLSYEKNQVSNQEDDRGYVSYGEKEVYYLEEIHTKTHVAKFITSEREDALEAFEPEESYQKLSDIETGTSTSRRALKKLDKIQLYTKKADGGTALIKTIYFDYDYSLCNGIPNSSTGKGILTLKKVWTEYEDIKQEKIYPYIFNYDYPDTDYPDKYNDLEINTTGLNENPNYSDFLLDGWGAYRADGTTRHNHERAWLDQNTATFDPAAWQLKQIILPTGGEVHVQYESDKYLYVHDHQAMAMVRLSSIDESGPEPKYYLDVDTDLGYTDVSDLNALKLAMNRYFVNGVDERGSEKVYFKFLYALFGNDPANLNDCNSGFIDGYASVEKVDIDGGGLYIQLKRDPSLPYNFLPKQVCKEFVKKRKFGELLLRKQCLDDVYIDAENRSTESVVMEELSRADQILAKLNDFVYNRINYCKNLDEDHSYFRIPILRAKRGGGLRVKRLLTYDKGLEIGDAVLYGSEYSYEDENGNSTGVASNEPNAVREENALIQYIQLRKEEKYLAKILAGTDKQQFEGPLGMSILPAPSVGYSKVTVNSIHSGKTSTGFSVNEFYTYKDFPIKVGLVEELGESPITWTDIQHKQFFLPILAPYVSAVTDLRWVAQGYRFLRYDIHGQPKRNASYSSKSLPPVSESIYEYFKPGDEIEVWNEFNQKVDNHYPGKEMEIIQETRALSEYKAGGGIEVDAGITLAPPVVIPQGSVGMGEGTSFSHKQLAMHVTNKLVSYPPIVKKVTQLQDGIVHSTENVAFDLYTGNPIWVKTTDEYNGVKNVSSSYADINDKHQGVYSAYTFPAHWEYDRMGPKYAANRLSIHNTKQAAMTINGTDVPGLYLLDFDPQNDFDFCAVFEQLVPGTLIKIMGSLSGVDASEYYYIEDNPYIEEAQQICIREASWTPTSNSLTSIAQLVVVESGFSNQLTTNISTLNTYSDGIDATEEGGITSTEKAHRESTLIPVLNASKGSTINTSSFINIKVMAPSGTCVDLNSYVPSISMNFNDITDGQDSTMKISVGPCEIDVPVNGEFKINSYGELEYSADDACAPIPIICLDLCPDYYPKTKIENVLNVQVSELSDRWTIPTSILNSYDKDDTLNLITNRDAYPYEFGKLGKWHPVSAYTYKTDIKGIEGGANLIQDGTAVFDDFYLFDWQYPESNNKSKWLRMNKSEKYAPDGTALEFKNILDVTSTIKKGYKNSLPYVSAQNASYENVYFESFENDYGSGLFEDNWLIDPAIATQDATFKHAGKSSLSLGLTGTACGPSLTGSGCKSNEIDLPTLKFDQQLINQGVTIQFWLRADDYSQPACWIVWNGMNNQSVEPITRTGEWVLYRADIKNWQFSPTKGSTITPQLMCSSTTASTINLDDLIVHPFDASVVASVYDVDNYRLLTTFDNNHFGSFYQYNQEGKLIRMQKETLKGLRTLSETHYNVPAKSR